MPGDPDSAVAGSLASPCRALRPRAKARSMTGMFLDLLVDPERMILMDGLTCPWLRVNNQLGVVPVFLDCACLSAVGQLPVANAERGQPRMSWRSPECLPPNYLRQSSAQSERRWGPLTFTGCQKGRATSRRPLPRRRNGAGLAADGRPPDTPVRWCRSRIRSAPRGPGAKKIWRSG